MNNVSIKYVSDSSITYEKYTTLSSLGIKNDGTSPQETSVGLNQALQDAKELGITKMVFPKGLYLLDETNPLVVNLKNIIIDFNGSTLQINSNELEQYSILEFRDGAEDVRFTNAILRGDEDSRDYLASVGIKQRGCGILIKGGKSLFFDNIILKEFTGSGISGKLQSGETLWEFTDTYVF